MSATGNHRVTRSASKARSVHSGAGGAATPGPAATSKRGRGTGSRRAASPAVVGAEEKPDVVNKTNQGYGTKGKPGQVQGLSAQLAMGGALEGIANAVNDAETGQAQHPASFNGLDPVDEENEDGDEDDEDGEGVDSSVARSRAFPLIVEHTPVEPTVPRPSFFSLQYWAPRGGDQQAFPVRQPSQLTQGDRMVGFLQWGSDLHGRNPVYVPHLPFSEFGVIVKSIICTIIALALWSLFLRPYFLGPQINSLAKNGTHQQLVYDPDYGYNFGRLNIRIGKLEQHLQKLHLGSQSFQPTPKHQVNWFTQGFGASIDAHLSSPTASVCDPTWKLYPWNWLFGRKCPEFPLSPPQMMALQSWEDPAFDRWCAPRSGGKLQLVIDLERTIAPTELVVEHVAKDASPAGYMGAAPKEVEVWIEMEDDNIRSTVADAIGRMWPGFLEDSSPQGKELSIEQTLGKGWLPIGRWIYNIYEEDNIQTFKIPLPLRDYGVQTTKIAIRVNSNWGDVDVTCVNRLRLHGHDTSGLVEELEEDPRLVKAA